MLLLILKAGANQYAIHIERVIELVPRVELRTIPHARPFVAGLLGYRGKVIPVIDLGLLLNGAPCRDCLSTRIILVNDSPADRNQGNDADGKLNAAPGHSPADPTRNSSLLGLVGEQVSDLVDVRSDQVMPAPVQLPEVPFLDAIIQTDAGIVQLIAVERIRANALESHLLEQGTASETDPLKAELFVPALEDLQTRD
jgi:chemotaxis-related protein WspB